MQEIMWPSILPSWISQGGLKLNIRLRLLRETEIHTLIFLALTIPATPGGPEFRHNHDLNFWPPEHMSLAPVIHPVGSNSSHPWPSTVEDPHRVNNVLSLQLWHSLPVNEIRLPILSSAPALFKEPSGVVSPSLRSPRLAIHVDHAAQDDPLVHRGRESNGKEKAETCCLARHCHSTASLQA